MHDFSCITPKQQQIIIINRSGETKNGKERREPSEQKEIEYYIIIII